MKGHTADPDDWSDGRLDEQKHMRENQLILFQRICQYKPMESNLIESIRSLFQKIDPQNSKPTEVEVPLLLMTSYAVSLAQD